MAKKKQAKMIAINFRLGTGRDAENWLKVIEKAAELHGNASHGVNTSTPKNEYIRSCLMKDHYFKQAAKALGIDLQEPPRRGTYDRQVAKRKATVRNLKDAALRKRRNSGTGKQS